MPATTPATRCRVFGMVWRAETQGVQGGDRAGAHGEDIAQDAADARRRSLIGLDEGGVVVALHLEDDGVAVAEIDDAGVFAGALDDARPGGGQRLQPFLRGFVGTVLVPHGGENAKLGDGRLAADEFEDAAIFVGLEPVLGDKLGRDRRVQPGRRQSSSASRRLPQALEQRPAVGRAVQAARSCFRDAASADDVAGLVHDAGDVAHGAIGIGAFRVAENDAALAFEAAERFGIGNVVAFAMGDRAAQDGAPFGRRLVKNVRLFSTFSFTCRQTNLSRNCAARAPGSKPGLGQDLEAVADAQHLQAPARPWRGCRP